MKEFNIFNPLLENRKLYDRSFYIFGFKGDIDKYAHEFTYRGGIPKYFGIDIERKTQSDKMVDAELLIYTIWGGGMIDWKCLYKNTKGVYMNKDKKRYYLKDFEEFQ